MVWVHNVISLLRLRFCEKNTISTLAVRVQIIIIIVFYFYFLRKIMSAATIIYCFLLLNFLVSEHIMVYLIFYLTEFSS